MGEGNEGSGKYLFRGGTPRAEIGASEEQGKIPLSEKRGGKKTVRGVSKKEAGHRGLRDRYVRKRDLDDLIAEGISGRRKM